MSTIDSLESAPRSKNGPLALLALLHVTLVIVAVSAWGIVDHDWPLTTTLGVTSSQAALCAYGAVLGRGRLAWRWTAWALVVAAGLLIFATLIRLAAPRIVPEYLMILLAAPLGVWIAVQVPLWIRRLRYRWCIDRGPNAQTARRPEDAQFGIKDILTWTAAVAMLCTVGRLALAATDLPRTIEWREALTFLSLVVVFNSLLSLLPLRACLGRECLPAWWVLTVTYSFVLVGLEPYAFAIAFDQNASRGAPYLLWLSVVQIVTLCASLLFLRAAGYRIFRTATACDASPDDTLRKISPDQSR